MNKLNISLQKEKSQQSDKINATFKQLDSKNNSKAIYNKIKLNKTLK